MQSLILFTALAAPSATHQTPNFIVEAPTAEVARRIAQQADRHRKRIARQWLGLEMPPWSEPCRVRVTLTTTGTGSSTEFEFRDDHARIGGMHLEGSLDRILGSALPHEIAHTVFAYDLARPVPRWADEGMAVLCEEEVEQDRYRRLCRQLLDAGRGFRLRQLFEMKTYPSEVMMFYAQGYSVTEFLVKRKGRATFLAFVDRGMRRGWDAAAQRYYGFAGVEELEEAWREWVREASPKQGKWRLTGAGGRAG
ncbi:MAG TPA: hypothetical protein VIL46_11870 [Gemmataceae bacterium]